MQTFLEACPEYNKEATTDCNLHIHKDRAFNRIAAAIIIGGVTCSVRAAVFRIDKRVGAFILNSFVTSLHLNWHKLLTFEVRK